MNDSHWPQLTNMSMMIVYGTGEGSNYWLYRLTNEMVVTEKFTPNEFEMTRRSKYWARHRSRGQVNLYSRPRSTLNTRIESPYSTSLFDGNSNVCPLFPFQISAVEMCMTLPRPLEWSKVKSKYANGNTFLTFYLLAITMIATSFTVCEIFIVEMCMTLTLTFRMSHGQM